MPGRISRAGKILSSVKREISSGRDCQITKSAKLAGAIVLLTVGSCNKALDRNQQLFDVKPSTSIYLPGNILLEVQNRSSEYVCIPIAEVAIGSPTISLQPSDRTGFVENKPPPKLLKGLDILQGFYVVPPNETYKILLDISNLGERVRTLDSIKGVVRGAVCRDLFQSGSANITAARFQIAIHIAQ